MWAADDSDALEERIGEWRNYLGRRPTIHAAEILELEDHLREQVGGLEAAGLAADEAFLIAVKRVGDLDALGREYAREHADRLWKQLVVSSGSAEEALAAARGDAVVAFCLAAAAAVGVKAPQLFGIRLEGSSGFYLRNLSFFALPLLAGYFAWKRRLHLRMWSWLGLGFGVAAVFANAYPLAPTSSTEALTALHLPIALWLVVGIAYAGGRWNQIQGRMDFIRFSGELFIYYVLIGLGGGVLGAFVAMTFHTIGINAQPFIASWLAPCGAAGAVLVASWLVETKQSVIENMAPVLTRLFTPLFAAMLVTFLAALAWTGHGVAMERNLLLGFNLLLLVVLGLLLYFISAREPRARPGAFEWMQVVLVVSALVADAVALWAIVARIDEFGFSANRAAVLGINLILFANLMWSAVLYVRFLSRQGTLEELERWQTNYLPVYAGWAAIVVIVFPPVFGFH